MQLDDFDFELPSELIAQYPLTKRSNSRLLVLNRTNNSINHLKFKELPKLLNPNDLLIFNDTKVIPARIWAKKTTGAKVELLLERIIDKETFLAHLKANKPLKIGAELILGSSYLAKIIGREDDLFIIKLNTDRDVLEIFEEIGHIPLPPYINRADEDLDQKRYQTVFARSKGAVAAPTAGLHFDNYLLNEITARGIDIDFITLHVGAGTFQPIRVTNILEHKMHKEKVMISKEVCAKINKAKKNGGRVIAIGTTVARSLETAARSGIISPFTGETDIFIYPGFKFQCIDALLTNFHLPKSTLLMLVAAFANQEQIKNAYQIAITERYRFFSYGDAMLIV
jgi:S-adenosylmethionine:tRNA ribosyltransferase-isomerase